MILKKVVLETFYLIVLEINAGSITVYC